LNAAIFIATAHTFGKLVCSIHYATTPRGH
jgi:hypothetical protein